MYAPNHPSLIDRYEVEFHYRFHFDRRGPVGADDIARAAAARAHLRNGGWA